MEALYRVLDFNMQKLIAIFIIQHLLYFSARVESLTGDKVLKARDGEFSYIASLQYFPDGEIFCAGVLITNKHVITIASCLEGEHPSKTRVVFEAVSPLEAIITELTYQVNSWQPYYSWAVGQGLHLKEPDTDGIAVMRLKDKVYHINPARLSELNKQQVLGRRGIITGWKNGISNDGLRVGIVNLLRDEECKSAIRKITNDRREIRPRVICNSAEPYVLLEDGDGGAPITDANKDIIGLAFGRSPHLRRSVSIHSKQFLQQYQVNIHFSVDYYRQFIVNITGYH